MMQINWEIHVYPFVMSSFHCKEIVFNFNTNNDGKSCHPFAAALSKKNKQMILKLEKVQARPEFCL